MDLTIQKIKQNDIKESNVNKITYINLLAVISFAVYYLLPSAQEMIGLKEILFMCFAYIAYNVIVRNFELSEELLKYVVIITYIALLYLLLTSTSTVSSTVSNSTLKRFLSKCYQLSLSFFPVYLLVQTINKDDGKKNRIIWLVVVFLLIFVIINTLIELTKNPNITRSWGREPEKAGENFAGYYFVYAIPLTIILCTCGIANYKNGFIKFIFLALIIFQLYFLLYAQYTLSVIASVIGITYEIIVNTKTKNSKLIALSVCVVGIVTLPLILKIAARYVPSEPMSIRLTELYNFLTSGNSSGYNLHGRMELYGKSIQAFLKSPIWGNRKLDFDGHATFLTVLADIGLLGGIPFYYLYFHSFKFVNQILGENRKYFKPFFIVLLFMGFTNPIHSALPLMFTMWFIVPFGISFIYKIER